MEERNPSRTIDKMAEGQKQLQAKIFLFVFHTKSFEQ